MNRVLMILGLASLSLGVPSLAILASDLNGDWSIILNTDGGTRDATANFQVEGEKVTGKWGPFDVNGTFIDRKLNLRFPITVPDQGMQGELKITGNLDGQKWTGHWDFEGYSGTLEAKRLAATDLNGQWDFVFNTDGGERRLPAIFQLDGEKVSGKMGVAAVKGITKSGEFDLSFPFTSDEGGITADLKIKGKFSGDQMTGNWEFAEYRGTWRATRSNKAETP